MPMHKKLAQTLFVKATEGGDIYLDTYEVFTLLAFTGTKVRILTQLAPQGWYTVKEETFVTEHEYRSTNTDALVQQYKY